ncbi:MAG: hypothetical protein IKR73_02060 [Oscillospiraceae bacterium]|nr:hypothetical protein [Oscillospiraceae bacterium]
MDKKFTDPSCAKAAVAAIAVMAVGCSSGAPAQESVTTAGTTASTTVSETAAIEDVTTEAIETTTAEETTTEETKTVEETAAEDGAVNAVLDPYAIAWDTDFSVLTTVATFRVDTENMTADFDGDGKDETIEFRPDESDGAKVMTDYENSGVLPLKPYLLGDEEKEIEIVPVMSDSGWYSLFDEYSISTPSGYMYVCDIDVNDGHLDIAYVPFTYTDDYCTTFMYYKDGKLWYEGSVEYDTPDTAKERWEQLGVGDMNIIWGRPLIVDGSGVVTGAIRGSFQTWFGYTQYAIDPDTDRLRELGNTGIWPYSYADRDDYDAVWDRVKRNWYKDEAPEDCLLLKEITVHEEPSEGSPAHTMAPGAAIPTGEIHTSDGRFAEDMMWSDDWEKAYERVWIYVTAKDGTSGWYHAYPYESATDIFSALTMYD